MRLSENPEVSEKFVACAFFFLKNRKFRSRKFWIFGKLQISVGEILNFRELQISVAKILFFLAKIANFGRENLIFREIRKLRSHNPWNFNIDGKLGFENRKISQYWISQNRRKWKIQVYIRQNPGLYKSWLVSPILPYKMW